MKPFRLTRASAAIVALLVCAWPAAPQQRVLTLRAAGGLPAHIAASFRDASTFQQARSGTYYVLDRRAHAVFRVDPPYREARQIVYVGHEDGRVLEPSALDVDPGGTFIVADAPQRVERVQIFGPAGIRLGGFSLPGRAAPRISIDGVVLSGIGSLRFTGRSILISQPETGALMTEYSLSGGAVRTIGALRTTGHEADRDVHLALNSGFPLVNPAGGFFFVFQSGIPMFRKYDQAGRLLFERHIEGRELDPLVQKLPMRWTRRAGEDELPLVPPLVRTAAVDPRGRLWISLVVPYTYVYDSDGDKSRTIQFRGTDMVSPSSLFFATSGRLLVAPGCYEFDVP